MNHQNQNDLHRSEATVRAIVATAVTGIITIDAKGAIHSFNPAADPIKLLKYPNQLNLLP